MRSIVKLTTKLSLFTLAVCLTMSNVLANTLSEVEINSLGDTYGIVLKTDEAAQMKKVISSNDRMSIELKDVNASENINTVYNNVANLDNVTIQPSSKNDIKIIFKGKDIANSKVSFETIKTDIPAATLPSQSIQLSGPVTSYKPVYSPETFASTGDSQTANPELNEILTQMHITREMLLTVKRYAKAAVKKANAMAHGDINMMTVVGIVLVIGAFMLKPRRKQGSVRPERAVALSSRDNLEREIDINRNLAGNMNLNGVSASKMGYGMKAYQQSQRNPYMSANTTTNGISGIARRKPLGAPAPIKKQPLKSQPVTGASAPLKNRVNTPIKSQAPQMRQLKNSAPTIQSKMNAPMKPASQSQPSTPSDLDSMKFLESITKIYEKNGRTDLAKGLKDNLRKAQLSQV